VVQKYKFTPQHLKCGGASAIFASHNLHKGHTIESNDLRAEGINIFDKTDFILHYDVYDVTRSCSTAETLRVPAGVASSGWIFSLDADF